MAWLRKHWRPLALSTFALSVLGVLIQQSSNNTGSIGGNFDPLFEQSGLWAIRFLLLSLSITPLNRLLGWRNAVKFRKPAGLWAFAFALIHVLTYVGYSGPDFDWLPFIKTHYIILGVTGLIILTVLALTSNRWSMKRLGKNWKRIHRLVYVAGGAVSIHALEAYANSKKSFIDNQTLRHELRVYLALLVVLLTLRVPLVRRTVRHVIITLSHALTRSPSRPLIVYAATPADREDDLPPYSPRTAAAAGKWKSPDDIPALWSQSAWIDLPLREKDNPDPDLASVNVEKEVEIDPH